MNESENLNKDKQAPENCLNTDDVLNSKDGGEDSTTVFFRPLPGFFYPPHGVRRNVKTYSRKQSNQTYYSPKCTDSTKNESNVKKTAEMTLQGEEPLESDHTTQNDGGGLKLIHFDVELFVCSFCNRTFEDQKDLKRHLLKHEKRFICNVCNKAFHQSGGLKYHLRIHTGEKPFICCFCNKAFRNQRVLKCHFRTHTGEKPYSCDHCNKSFMDDSGLKAHLRIHTGEKPFKCNLCNKAFKQKGSLKAHQVIHSSEKLYTCTHCDKKFARKYELKRHEKIHSDNKKPCSCNLCDKAFTQMSRLNSHLRLHTGENLTPATTATRLLLETEISVVTCPST